MEACFWRVLQRGPWIKGSGLFISMKTCNTLWAAIKGGVWIYPVSDTERRDDPQPDHAPAYHGTQGDMYVVTLSNDLRGIKQRPNFIKDIAVVVFCTHKHAEWCSGPVNGFGRWSFSLHCCCASGWDWIPPMTPLPHLWNGNSGDNLSHGGVVLCKLENSRACLWSRK